MYKIICRELGFDCDFVMKKTDRMAIVNNLSKHLMINHNTYYPKKEISVFVDKQNNILESNNFEAISESDSLTKKGFSGRKNFP